MRKVISALMMGLCAVAVQIPIAVHAADSDSMVIERAPPLSRHEPLPKKARHGFIWARGYWIVSGRHYKWKMGHWILERPGYKYQQAEWVKVPGGWQLRPGHWQQLPATPAQG
jgi:hypothetical protein